MMMQLILGIMSPIAMFIVAMVIAAEKILPRPEITSRLVGLAAIVTGISWILS
jgi:multisubunit Na+/H+ antiporter MnhF subunit